MALVFAHDGGSLSDQARGAIHDLGPAVLGRPLCPGTWRVKGLEGTYRLAGASAALPFHAMYLAIFRARVPQRVRLGSRWVKGTGGNVAADVVPCLDVPGALPRFVRAAFYAALRDLLVDRLGALDACEPTIPFSRIPWREAGELEETALEWMANALQGPPTRPKMPPTPEGERASIAASTQPRDAGPASEREAEELDRQAAEAAMDDLGEAARRVVTLALDRTRRSVAQLMKAARVSKSTVFRSLRAARAAFKAHGADFDAIRAIACQRAPSWRPDDVYETRRLLRPMTRDETNELHRGYRILGCVHPSFLTKHEEVPAMPQKPRRTPDPAEIVTIVTVRDLGRVQLPTGDSRHRGMERREHRTCTYAEAMLEIERLRATRKPGSSTFHGIVRRPALSLPRLLGAAAPAVAANEPTASAVVAQGLAA